MSVRLRHPHGRLERRQTHHTDATVDAFGLNGVAVVNDPSIGLLA
jgi:hypothetical protein